jgi:ABC-2 type transport system permease protein
MGNHHLSKVLNSEEVIMSKIIAIARKDILLAFSSRSQLLFFIILPVIFTYILGSAFGSSGDSSRITLAVVDHDGSQLSAALVEQLSAGGTVAPEVLAAAEAEEHFADERTPAILTIPAGFEAQVTGSQPATLPLQKAHNDFNAQAADQAVERAIATVSRPWLIGQSAVAALDEQQPFVSDQTRAAALQESVALAQQALASSPERVRVSRPAAASDDYDPVTHASVGQLVTWVFVPLLGASALFANERNQGTLRRLVVSPARKSTFLLGAVSGQLSQAVVQMALLVVFGMVVMKVNWGQSVPALAIMLFTFGLASVALGVTLGTFVKSSSQANNLSIAAGMAMALLGGAWFPMEIFPQAAQTVAQVLPTTWAVHGLTELAMRGGGLADIALPAAVLTGFAVIFLAVGTWRFRYE